MDDLELDRNPCYEHRGPDPVAVDRRCSTYLQLAGSQSVEPIVPDDLAQLSVRLLVRDQEVDVGRFAELTVREDDRGAASEPAVVLCQERCVENRQHLSHLLVVQPPKQGASRCCRCPPSAG